MIAFVFFSALMFEAQATAPAVLFFFIAEASA